MRRRGGMACGCYRSNCDPCLLGVFHLLGGLLPRPPPEGFPVVLGAFGGRPPPALPPLGLPPEPLLPPPVPLPPPLPLPMTNAPSLVTFAPPGECANQLYGSQRQFFPAALAQGATRIRRRRHDENSNRVSIRHIDKLQRSSHHNSESSRELRTCPIWSIGSQLSGPSSLESLVP